MHVCTHPHTHIHSTYFWSQQAIQKHHFHPLTPTHSVATPPLSDPPPPQTNNPTDSYYALIPSQTNGYQAAHDGLQHDPQSMLATFRPPCVSGRHAQEVEDEVQMKTTPRSSGQLAPSPPPKWPLAGMSRWFSVYTHRVGRGFIQSLRAIALRILPPRLRFRKK